MNDGDTVLYLMSVARRTERHRRAKRVLREERGLSYQHRSPGTSLKQHLQAESACYLEQVNSNGPNVLVWAHFDGG